HGRRQLSCAAANAEPGLLCEADGARGQPVVDGRSSTWTDGSREVQEAMTSPEERYRERCRERMKERIHGHQAEPEREGRAAETCAAGGATCAAAGREGGRDRGPDVQRESHAGGSGSVAGEGGEGAPRGGLNFDLYDRMMEQDYRLFHDELQMDLFILARESAGDAYGGYMQALKELHARRKALRELYASRQFL